MKVLGLSWDPSSDQFTFLAAKLPSTVVCTKRAVLSLIARVYDPLGFVLPFTMSARILFQDIWRLGVDWDEEIPDELEKMFRRWLSDLNVLTAIQLPRQYFNAAWAECVHNLELHAFGDASLRGYGASVYVRFKNAAGEIQCTLVRACGRVAPLVRKTLPRLELLGSLVTAQLLQSVIKSLQLPDDVKYTCWTDSMVALGWIHGLPSKWKPWVANRVTAIQGMTKPERWRHISGVTNPADLVSRGTTADKLVDCELWWHGPAFLMNSEGSEPDATSIIMPDGNVEVEKERKVTVDRAMLLCVEAPDVYDMQRWSTYNKALRVIAWTLRFISGASKKGVPGENLKGDDYMSAKVAFVKILQHQNFAKEIAVLKAGRAISQHSKLAKLSPFVDEEGVLRVRGRIQLSALAFESKHPIILPKCHGSMLLVRFVHFLLNHGGVDAIITYLRKDYEIFGLRQMAKRVKRDCVFCQRCDVRACNEPPAPLPSCRVTMAPVFSVTGMDYAGPVFCLDYPGEKFYICLFVCGVVRAIHLELVDSLSTDDFILAYRRFSALKRAPSVLYSDNGKNFVGGDRALRAYLGPEWRFICP